MIGWLFFILWLAYLGHAWYRWVRRDDPLRQRLPDGSTRLDRAKRNNSLMYREYYDMTQPAQELEAFRADLEAELQKHCPDIKVEIAQIGDAGTLDISNLAAQPNIPTFRSRLSDRFREMGWDQ